MKKLICIFFIILSPILLLSQSGGDGKTSTTGYYGTITSSQTWTTAYNNGIIYVGQNTANLYDLTIGNGGSLTIEAGVTIIFCTSASDLKISGSGSLTAIGNISNLITFTKLSSNSNWGHLSFEGSTGISVVTFCLVEYGLKSSTLVEGYGGGIHINSSNVTISSCLVRNNTAVWGGGIFVNKNVNPTISNCQIYSNTATSGGGGLYFWNNSYSKVTNCIVFNNRCTGTFGGGGIFLGPLVGNALFYNCVVVSNTNNSNIGNNILFYGNTNLNRPKFYNTIVWGSNSSIRYSSGQTPLIDDFNNCSIPGYITGYTSCINLNAVNNDPAGPNFTDPLTNDYSLTVLSPCIDKGLNAGAPLTDIIGNPRVGITDIGAYENQDYLWQGDDVTSPTLWNVANNWNSSVVPSAVNVLYIRGSLTNYPVVNTNAIVESITIASGASLTINPTYTLTVNGALTNNAGNTGIIIKSDATGDGKLINNTSAVPATVELYLSGGLISPTIGTFHYFVPPVETMSIGTIPTVDEVKTALGLTNFKGDLLRYNEPASVGTKETGWQYFDNYPLAPPGFTSLQSTTGYNIYLNGPNDIIKFKGNLNAGPNTFNLSYTPGNAGAGWNLVGNPFPCNYDLNGISGLGTIVSGISNTVYYNNNGGYTYWNVFTNTGSSGYSDILPPMTGFFVKVSQGGPSTLLLPASSKTASSSDLRSVHKSFSTASEKGLTVQKVKLVLTSGSKTDETIALLFDDATNSYNEHYDAYKLFNAIPATPNIYIELNGVDYFMKAVAGPVNDPVIVPLKIVLREAGTHRINITEFENLEGIKVVLKHGAIETNLSQNASYSFTAGAGTLTDFQLIIGENNITTGTENIPMTKLKSWYSNNSVYINFPGEIQSNNIKLLIYDFNGRQIFTSSNLSLIPAQTTQIPVNLKNGFYIIDIIIDNIHYKSKIVVY